MLQQLTSPVVRILSHLGLGQKLSLLGLLVLSPQWLLAHRYLQLIEDPATHSDAVIFLSLSSALTVYFLLAYFFAGRNAQ